MSEPIPMLLWCPECSERHLDVGAFATKPHHMHACQHCGHVWRPAVVPTVGVQFLPGFKNLPVCPGANECRRNPDGTETGEHTCTAATGCIDYSP